MRHRARGDLAILLSALILASACATPVGVVRGNPQLVYRALTSSVLSTGEPSAFTAASFNWGGYRMTRFIPVAEFEVRGLANRYRQPGVGAPLAAELAPTGEGPEAAAARKRIPRGSRCR